MSPAISAEGICWRQPLAFVCLHICVCRCMHICRYACAWGCRQRNTLRQHFSGSCHLFSFETRSLAGLELDKLQVAMPPWLVGLSVCCRVLNSKLRFSCLQGRVISSAHALGFHHCSHRARDDRRVTAGESFHAHSGNIFPST